MHGGVGVRGKVVCAERVVRQQEFGAGSLGFGQNRPCLVQHVVFHEARADGTALGFDEGVRHPASDNQLVHAVDEVFEDAELAAYLCAADDGEQGLGRSGQHLVERFHFALHEQPKRLVLREELRNDGRGRMGAVGRPKGVVHVDVAALGKLASEELVPRFFLAVEAEVFKEGHLTGLEVLGDVQGFVAHAVVRKFHGLAQQVGQGGHDVLERELGARSLGTAEVAHQHH